MIHLHEDGSSKPGRIFNFLLSNFIRCKTFLRKLLRYVTYAGQFYDPVIYSGIQQGKLEVEVYCSMYKFWIKAGISELKVAGKNYIKHILP